MVQICNCAEYKKVVLQLFHLEFWETKKTHTFVYEIAFPTLFYTMTFFSIYLLSEVDFSVDYYVLH